MWGWVLSSLGRVLTGNLGRGLRDTAQELIDAYARLRDAETEIEKANIERQIEQIKVLHDLQSKSSKTFWSPMMVGQYLIVVPFGLWWASIYLVSILNDNLAWQLVVQDVPPDIKEMATWLVPMIVVGTFIDSKLRR